MFFHYVVHSSSRNKYYYVQILNAVTDIYESEVQDSDTRILWCDKK